MRYRAFGSTGLEVSEISLGTWAMSSTAYGETDDSKGIAAIHAALDAGINFYDTAPLYGTKEQDGISEIILGKGLGSKRKDVLIATKFGRKPSDDYKPFFNQAYALQSVEESLQRLGTDYIDVLFFHSPFSPNEIDDDVWLAMDRLQSQGKVRLIGHSVSMFQDTQQMSRDWADDRKIQCVQVVYSLMNRESQQFIQDMGKQGIGVVARESLANGYLTGTVTRDTVWPEGHLNSRHSSEENTERVDYVDQLKYLVRDEIKTMPQAALRWVLDCPQVSTVLSGAMNTDQILDCAAASMAQGFTEEEHAKAALLHKRDYEAA